MTKDNEQHRQVVEKPISETRQNEPPRLVNLGKIAELTHGSGRQWVDGRKDSERE
jgi:hypothetical protein